MNFSVAEPAEPAVPRDAATVLLLRDGDDGLEVFLQRRVAAMAFAAGMTVFPGGGVDQRDADATVAWAGPPAAEWAGWFNATEQVARALVCAAVRETFEESGVLLAGTADEVVTDTARYAGAREALVSRELSLADFLAREGLTCARTCCVPGRTGSRRHRRSVATTPASSPRSCPRARRPTARPPRPNPPAGSDRPTPSPTPRPAAAR